MARVAKNVIIEKNGDSGDIKIMAPIVGVYYRPPRKGVFLNTGSHVGIIKTLRSYIHLRIPEKVRGFVSTIATADKTNPVQYRQHLFTIRAAQVGESDGFGEKEKGDYHSISENLESQVGSLSITSPTDGVFYRRPGPEEKPYAEKGQIISTGQVIGLVEVMKSFNQIRFSGPDMPERAKIEAFLVEDGAEIQSGQIICRLAMVDA